MNAIVNGKIVLPDGVVEGRTLVFEQKIIGLADVRELPQDVQTIDACGGYVIPGLIDIHIHGYLGEDASDGSLEGLRRMAEGVARNGVTAFLPTTMTVSYDDLRKAFAQICCAMTLSERDDWMGAAIVGANAEGPFINESQRGAQPREYVRKGDAAFLKEYKDVIRVFTIAPETDGNLECIREIARDTDMLISMGHTAATFEQACEAVEAGVRHVTHLFNRQSALSHRAPGVVGEALSDARVSCELIADTFHVHKGLFRLVAKAKGDKLTLVTDCTRAGGMPDGEYTLGGQPIFVHGIECRLKDGTIAGSVLRLNEAVRNMLDNTDLAVNEAVNMASLNPAMRIGIADKKGSIEPGKDADFAIVDERFNVQRTILSGRTIWSH